MSDESSTPSATTTRPSRVRARAWGTALPVAVAIGAVFAAPIAAVLPVGTFGGSSEAILADKCESPSTQATPTSEVAFGAVAAKWPKCGGD